MRKSIRGFTLVELLIVIVVIAILASITTVTYASITKRANDSNREVAIQTLAKKLELFYTENGAYPSHSEMSGTAAAATLGTTLESISPPENITQGFITPGWRSSSVSNPTKAQYRFTYITNGNANGSGWQCGNTTRCPSFDVGYITADGTAKRLVNPGSLRAGWTAP